MVALFGVADPSAIKPTKPYKRILLFRPGELTSAVPSVLRKGKRPMTTPEIITATLAALGHERASEKVMYERIRSCNTSKSGESPLCEPGRGLGSNGRYRTSAAPSGEGIIAGAITALVGGLP